MLSAEYHTPVLIETVLHYLQASRKGIYVDGTLGGGGHAESIFRVSSPESRLVGFDVDTQAISFAQQRLKIFDNRII